MLLRKLTQQQTAHQALEGTVQVQRCPNSNLSTIYSAGWLTQPLASCSVTPASAGSSSLSWTSQQTAVRPHHTQLLAQLPTTATTSAGAEAAGLCLRGNA